MPIRGLVLCACFLGYAQGIAFGRKQGQAGKLEDESTLAALQTKYDHSLQQISALQQSVLELKKRLSKCEQNGVAQQKDSYFQKSIPIAPYLREGEEVPFVGKTGL